MNGKLTGLFIFILIFILTGFTHSTFAGDLVINEIHADPHTTLGDANGDGTRHSSQDEFVEIVNTTGSAIDISGWTLSDAGDVRHIFPAGTVLSGNHAIVIFGGGSPAGSFGGAIVQTASNGGLSLNNTGDTVTLNDGVAIQDEVVYGSEANHDASLVRDPDLTGSFVRHNYATDSGGALFSPGTKINGDPFSSHAPGITFNDPNLELAVRDALGKPTGTIYDTDMESLTDFVASSLNISDLTGLEYAINLVSLNLGTNQISDLDPIQALTLLEQLHLEGNSLSNSDLPDLYALDNLIYLNLSGNAGINSGAAMQILGDELDRLDCTDIIWDGICGTDPLLALGNLIFFDPNLNSHRDGSEPGIADITVELYLDSDQSGNFSPGDTQVNTTTTNSLGEYGFADLAPGDYIVYIPPANFQPGQPLKNHLSSPGVSDPNNDVNNDDNGVDDDHPATNGIATPVISLQGDEPENHGTTNNSLDLGFMPPLEAAFKADTTWGIGSLAVHFNNLTSAPATFEWDLGDGTTSTEEEPQHVYTCTGCTPPSRQFTVSLKATAPNGEDTEVKVNYITVYSPAHADFSAEQPEICSGQEVTLTNNSCGAYSEWTLNWGDGAVETGQTLVTEWKHTYATDLPTQTFTVTLDVAGIGGTDTEVKTDYIIVHGPMVADFSASETKGIAPMEVQFANLSQGWITSCLWDFGDGTTSEELHPKHTYSGYPNRMTVQLTVSGPCDQKTVTKTDYITANHAVKVLFEAAPIVGASGLDVQFTNNSGGNANLFTWDYGDGTVETIRHGIKDKVHPYHIYRKPGEYAVTLKASGHGGSDELTLPGLIYVDDTYYYLPLVLAASGQTYPGEGWDNAIDHDIYGAGSTVAAVAGDAWAIFTFADSALHPIEKFRLLTDTVEPHQMTTNLTYKFKVHFSRDGEKFATSTVFTGWSRRKDGIWEEFMLKKTISAKAIKVELVTARGKKAKYIELAEFQVFGPPPALSFEKEAPLENAEPMEVPDQFVLEQNYPNPFNPETRIRFHLPEAMQTTLSIYNLQGQLIRTLVQGNLNAGIYNYLWDSKNTSGEPVAGGIYLYQLRGTGAAEKVLMNRKMILMK